MKTDKTTTTASAQPERRARFEDLYKSDPVAACKAAIKATREVSQLDRMEAINDLLGCYGIEAIRGQWQNGYWCDIVATYCNTGDSYATTVLQVRNGFNTSRLIVSSVGDFVERHGQKLHIQ